jgi:hypothetical protein
MTERTLVLLIVIGGILIGGFAVRAFGRRNRTRAIESLRLDTSSQARILSFYGASYDACDKQKAILAELERDRSGVTTELRDASVDYDYARQFGLMIVPTTVVIDPDGTIRGIHSGFIPRPVLEAELDAA